MGSKKKEWFAALLGLALVAYGIGGYITSRMAQVETNLVWWAQAAGVVVVGGALFSWGLGRLLSKGGRPTPVAVITNPNSRVRTTVSDGIIDTQEQKDFEALHHMAARLRGNPQGLSLCRQLQDCLFELHHGSLLVEEGHSISFKSSIESDDQGTRLQRSKIVAEPTESLEHRDQ